jgi:hypothetical protein
MKKSAIILIVRRLIVASGEIDASPKKKKTTV